MKQENSDPIKVIIADDHVLYRAGVKTALSTKKDLKIIAEADNGMHLLTLLKTTVADVILLDIEMPIMTGINVLPEIKKLYPGIKIIMLTMMDNHSMVTQLMELGANSRSSSNSHHAWSPWAKWHQHWPTNSISHWLQLPATTPVA